MSQLLVFSSEQKKAINHSKGHLRIIACPGSGKTEVVSRQVAKLIQRGADPKTIVAFTFTEKAAEELKTRIRKILDRECPTKADFGDMFVGTIHGFCFHILKEIEPAFRSYDVLDEAKRVAFLSKPEIFFRKINLDALKQKHHLSHYDTILQFAESADIMMMEDIDTSKLHDKEFKECYNNYRQVLNEEKYFDFSSIMHTFVEFFAADRERKKLLGEHVRYVILDEYQDVNNIQESILRLLSEGAESVCVVGDDDQSIYHWRGSNVDVITGFKDRYKKKYRVKDCHLDKNFRSTDAVVNTARSFIEHNGNRLKKAMVKSKKLKRKFEKGDLFYRHFENEEDEFRFIVNRIRQLRGTDFTDKKNNPFSLSLSDIAILVRTNSDAARIIEFLDQNNIACIAYSGTSIFERPVVRLAMDCIGYVFSCRGYTTNNVPRMADLRTRYSQIFDSSEYPQASPARFAKKLKAIKKQADKILKKSPRDYLGGLGLQEYYYKILNAMGSEDFNFSDVFHFNLAQLSAAISDYEAVWIRLRASEIVGFFYFVFAWARIHYADTQHADTTNIKAVSVLTYHKAKGLEFPVVFMPCFVKRARRRGKQSFVDDSLFDADMYSGNEEDDRRMYYVAMTRSEKYLAITGSSLRNGLVRKKHPHPFVNEIVNGYFSDRLAIRRKRSGHPTRAEVTGTFPTSFTQLSSFERCPQDFKLRHVFGYNAGVPVAFGFGTNIHNILSMIHTKYIREQRLPTDTEIDRIFDRMFKLRYATKAISEPMKKSGINIVKNYVKLHKDDFKRILETEKNFEFVIDEALISGQIDLLKKVDDAGNLTAVEIIDFKTEKKDGVYEVNHDRQLRFYAIACLKSLGLRPKKAFVHHLDKNEKSEVDISPARLDETRDGIRKDVKRILAKKFTAKPKKHICEECDYRIICPFKKLKIAAAS